MKAYYIKYEGYTYAESMVEAESLEDAYMKMKAGGASELYEVTEPEYWEPILITSEDDTEKMEVPR